MARRLREDDVPTPDPGPRVVTCDHGRLAGPRSALLCDPRVIFMNIDAGIIDRVRAAYADHRRNNDWPGLVTA